MKQDDDFIKYCRDNYHTPLYNEDEFRSDVKKIIILKKMFKRYHNTGQLNERLILNNIIILINVFGVEASNIILFYRIEKVYYSYIKAFLQYLNCYIENPISQDVEPSEDIINMLRERVR